MTEKLLLILLVLSSQLVNAQVPEKIAPFVTPFGEFQFERPRFPDNKVSIVEFEARAGGEFKNTSAIKDAIEYLSEQGGGMVVVPAGQWLTGPIVLKSNINLHLEEGAELLFSQDFNDYLPAVLTNYGGSEVYSYSPFIYAFKKENIALTGKGVLNGQGKPWWEQRYKGKVRGNELLQEMNEKEVPVEERRFDNPDYFLRPVFFGPLYCKNILVEGVTFKYGPFWTVNPSFCDHVIVRDIYVLTNGHYGDTPNGDGINPNSCSNVLIEYNTLDTGDDCITIKSGRNKDGRRIGMPSKNILIRHNKGLQGHGGIVIGSEMSGGVENVYAHDCRFNGTDRVIRIKTARGRGGYVKNCWFKNISADTIEKQAIRINMMYTGGDRLPAREVDQTTPVIENLHYENITCDFAKGNVIQIVGIPEMPVKNISFENLVLKGRNGMVMSDAKNLRFENLSISNLSGPATEISHSDSIYINNIKIDTTDESKIPFIFKDATNLSLQKIVHNHKGDLVHITGSQDNIVIDKSIPENKIRKEAIK